MDDEEQRDHCEETYVRAMAEREGSEELEASERYDRAAVAEAAERNRRPGDTSAAIAANRRRGLDRKAEELRAAGYHVLTPEDYAREREVWAARHTGVERHEFGSACMMHGLRDCESCNSPRGRVTP
jgi:hypothetical protein